MRPGISCQPLNSSAFPTIGALPLVGASILACCPTSFRTHDCCEAGIFFAGPQAALAFISDSSSALLSEPFQVARTRAAVT